MTVIKNLVTFCLVNSWLIRLYLKKDRESSVQDTSSYAWKKGRSPQTQMKANLVQVGIQSPFLETSCSIYLSCPLEVFYANWKIVKPNHQSSTVSCILNHLYSTFNETVSSHIQLRPATFRHCGVVDLISSLFFVRFVICSLLHCFFVIFYKEWQSIFKVFSFNFLPLG